MAATAELDRLLGRAGVIPYRRVGKVRLAFQPGTPGATIEAAAGAVKAFAPAMVDVWGEPSAATAFEWKNRKLEPRDVCDDPCPADVDPMTIAVGWLIARCERYHFRLTCTADGFLSSIGLNGWKADTVKPLLPAWFADACRKRKDEITAALREGQ